MFIFLFGIPKEHNREAKAMFNWNRASPNMHQLATLEELHSHNQAQYVPVSFLMKVSP
jgi:hypothetical protein